MKPKTDEHQSILTEAEALVHGDRNADYGHPLDDFTRTALLWTGILLDVLKPDRVVTPEQVGLCMAALKLSRQCNKPKRDNMVDAAGYCETVEWLMHERDKRYNQRGKS